MIRKSVKTKQMRKKRKRKKKTKRKKKKKKKIAIMMKIIKCYREVLPMIFTLYDRERIPVPMTIDQDHDQNANKSGLKIMVFPADDNATIIVSEQDSFAIITSFCS